MLNELIHDPWSIVVVVVVMLFIAILYFRGKKKTAAKVALELIKIAEEVILGSGKGAEKQSLVYNALYPLLPRIIKYVWKEHDVYMFIDWVFEKNKDIINNIIEKENRDPGSRL